MSKHKPRKTDKTIVIALIGLTGTIVTAVLTSPVLIKLLDKTPASESGQAAEIDPTPVFYEDFEKGYASGLSFTSDEWQVMETDEGFALEVSGLKDANTTVIFGPNDFTDGRIEFRLYFVNFDGFVLNFRSKIDVETYTLNFSPEGREISLGYNSSANDWTPQPLEDGVRPFVFTEGVWYTARLESLGAQLSLWVDDKKLMTTQDERLTRGNMELAVQNEGTVLLDDIAVYQANP